jgi:phosphoglycolate phosphatase-like HAD superfamily hydrolase
MREAMTEVWGIPDPLAGVSFVGGTDSGVAHQVAPGADRAPMWARYEAILRAMAAASGPRHPLPGVVALLDRLHAIGSRVGLLTGNIRAGARIKLESTGLWDRFDLHVSAFAEDGVARDEIAAVARLRAGDGPLVVVGDTPADVACGRHVGARVLGVGTGYAPREAVEAARPDRFVADLSDTDDIVRWCTG